MSEREEMQAGSGMQVADGKPQWVGGPGSLCVACVLNELVKRVGWGGVSGMQEGAHRDEVGGRQVGG